MFDSHCHLNFKAFRDDAESIATTMAEEKVSGLVVGCDRFSSQAAIALANQHPNLWATVGLHPIHVLDDPWDDAHMLKLAQNDRVVAIGEVGLDFYRFPDNVDRQLYLDAQCTTFRSAIALAKQVQKPLVIHSRQAYDEIIEVLAEAFPDSAGDQLRGTVHCFMGNWTQAQKLLDLGFMLGFTGVITYADADPALLEVVTKAPLERILIETDAPYLTPEPHRTEGKKAAGKTPRNIPQYTREVARQIGQLRNQSTEEIIQLTEQNGYRLFNLEDPYER